MQKHPVHTAENSRKDILNIAGLESDKNWLTAMEARKNLITPPEHLDTLVENHIGTFFPLPQS